MPIGTGYHQSLSEEPSNCSTENVESEDSPYSNFSKPSSTTSVYQRNTSSHSECSTTIVLDSPRHRELTFNTSNVSSFVGRRYNCNTRGDSEIRSHSDDTAIDLETNENNIKKEIVKLKEKIPSKWRLFFRFKTDPELVGLTREEQDKVKYKRVKKKLSVWCDRTTFHGVDVIKEAPKGWTKLLVFLFVVLMCILCWTCVFYMVHMFLNRPVITVVVKDASEFRFPAITLCPDSPFSMAQLKEAGALEK